MRAVQDVFVFNCTMRGMNNCVYPIRVPWVVLCIVCYC